MRRKAKDDDEEWLPSEVVGEEEGEDEGVFEDTDPVLTEGISQQTEEEMDTIARMAKHPYFLRSLMKPEAFGFVGQNAPTQGGWSVRPSMACVCLSVCLSVHARIELLSVCVCLSVLV